MQERDQPVKPLVMTKRTVVVLLLSFLASLGFAQEPQLIRATDDVYLFGAGAFSMFVVTSDGVVVVDPVEPHQAELLDAAIDTVTDQPVRFVLYSHNHWDHITGLNCISFSLMPFGQIAFCHGRR